MAKTKTSKKNTKPTMIIFDFTEVYNNMKAEQERDLAEAAAYAISYMDEKTENNAVPYYRSGSYLCSSFCTGTYGKTGISVRNSGAVFVIYDTLSDRGMGHHLPGCAQYQSWSGI